MLITFILLGKYLEAAAKSRTSAAITRLLQLTPPTAILLTLDDKGNVVSEQELPTSLVHRGDLLKVCSRLWLWCWLIQYCCGTDWTCKLHGVSDCLLGDIAG